MCELSHNNRINWEGVTVIQKPQLRASLLKRVKLKKKKSPKKFKAEKGY